MQYYILADMETECEDHFPRGLSYFFEKVGAHGEKSTVSQVEAILRIDLSIFQEYDFIGNEDPNSTYWKNINEFEGIIDLFLENIENNPDYYKYVKYHPIVPEYGFSTDSTITAQMRKIQEEYENHPMYGYPNDDGYLSKGDITKDLYILKSILSCYRKSGVRKIKLNYD